MANSRVNIKHSERFDSCVGEPPVFKFPPPPRMTPPTSTSDTSDSQTDVRWSRDPLTTSYKRRTRSVTANGGGAMSHHATICGGVGGTPSSSIHRSGYQSDPCNDKHPSKLPPVGVFWDIENCQIPHGKSALTVVHAVRETFFEGFREAEFLVVCDVKKENSVIIQELNDAQVNVVHVNSTSKNAADDKLRLAIGRFADLHGTPSAVILISSDVNFAPDLSDLRYRKKIHVIVLHNNFCAEPLIKCANEHYNFCEFLYPLPNRTPLQNDYQVAHIVVTNLPTNHDERKIKHRLKFLSQNCGGRIISVTGPKAILKFPNLEIASRAIKRMDGEIVYGNTIVVSCPQITNEPSKKETSAVKERTNLGSGLQNFTSTLPLLAQPCDSLFSDEEPLVNNYLRGFSFNNCWSTPKKKISGKIDSPLASKLETLPCTGSVNTQNYDYTVNCSKDGSEMYELFNNGLNGVRFLPQSSEIRLNKKDNPISNYSETSRKTNLTAQGIDSTKYFHPINSTNGSDAKSLTTVDLYIKNLDQAVDPSIMKKLLFDIFSKTISVLNLTIYVERDGNYAAQVQVGLQEAQTAISRLNGVRIGQNEIEVSCSPHPYTPITEETRLQIKRLLQETPHCKMPLSKFQELLNYRASIRISTWDLSRLSDICLISNENGCDMISLPAQLTMPSKPIEAPVPDAPCFDEDPLIKVNVQLSAFSSNVDMLLAVFNDSIPLSRFYSSYCTMCGPLTLSEKGVPLEHLITCVDNIVLRSIQGDKFVQRRLEKTDDLPNEITPPLSKFKVDVVDLLKDQPESQVSFGSFATAYHHKFGHQIKISEYGFTKLINLFEAVSCTVQVLGTGGNRFVTLTHRAQVNRFALDLQTALQCQPSKLIDVEKLPALFESTLGARPFDPSNYGLCYLCDLLYSVPKDWVEINVGRSGMVVRWLRDERTPEERERFKSFIYEVWVLLKCQPNFSVLFDHFFSLYQQHFGQECVVSEYGFTELRYLIERASDTVELLSTEEGDLIVLTREKKLHALNERIMLLVPPFRCLPLIVLVSTYSWKYHAELRPSEFNLSSLEALVRRLTSVKIVEGGKAVALVEFAVRKIMAASVKKLLINSIDGQVSQELIDTSFSSYPEEYLKLDNVVRLIPDAAKLVDNGTEPRRLEVTPLYQFVRQMVSLLNHSNGHLLVDSFETCFLKTYSSIIKPNVFGFSSIVGLLKSLADVVTLYGNGSSRQIVLKDGLTYQEGSTKRKTGGNQESVDGSQRGQPSVSLDYMPRPPDPSELPLPSLRLYASPSAENDGSSHTVRDGRSTVSSSDSSCNLFSPKNILGQERIKGRLAAQFKQPFDLN